MDQLPDDLHNLRPSPTSNLMFLLALAAALGLVITALLAMS